MLAGLLKSQVAVEMSIKIVDVFFEMRKLILSNSDILGRLINVEQTLLEHNKNFNDIFTLLNVDDAWNQKIFTNGQVFDAYYLIIELIRKVTTDIIIIDNYIDETILKMLEKKNKNVDVLIITSKKAQISKLDISKFNTQYSNLKINYSNDYHDRFIIIDSVVYHCGASFKDLGKKTFGINKMESFPPSIDRLLKFIKNPH